MQERMCRGLDDDERKREVVGLISSRKSCSWNCNHVGVRRRSVTELFGMIRVDVRRNSLRASMTLANSDTSAQKERYMILPYDHLWNQCQATNALNTV